MPYAISMPVDVVFDAIEDLVDLSDHGQTPLPVQKQLDLAYVILAKEPILAHSRRATNLFILSKAIFRFHTQGRGSHPTALIGCHNPAQMALQAGSLAIAVATHQWYPRNA